jgi:hypothetical protein
VARHNLNITELGRVRFDFETTDIELNFYQPHVLNLELTLEPSHKRESAQYIGSLTLGQTAKNKT